MMIERLRRTVSSLIAVDPEERQKLWALSVTFFLVIAAYTITKDLKDSIFASIVGKEYIPKAKIITVFILIPAILLYSRLVDKLRRYHLLCFYTSLYAILGFIFALLLGHPQIGLSNTDSSPDRIFGWLFYFFIEGYSPFVVSVFWAFANSITNPEAAKKNYGLMVSASKIGGIVSSLFAIWLMDSASLTAYFGLNDTLKHQIALVVSSLFLCGVPVIIIYLMKNVPGQYLHGYEAVYKLEKERSKAGLENTGVFSGFVYLMRYPYVMGIFGIIFFYELVNTVLSYQRVLLAGTNASSLSDVSSFLFKLTFAYQFIGLFISLLGTRVLLSILGERLCLLAVPLLTGSFLVYFMVSYSKTAFIITFVSLRAINYSLSYPVREVLYIPTVKDLKFKAKSWIDAFGTKFAKTTGSMFNSGVVQLAPALSVSVHGAFFAVVIGLWVATAWALGRRYDQAVANNEVVGA